MTRKHFEVLAKNISEIADRDARLIAAIAVARAAIEINPRFDPSKFYKACGVA